ncbi:MAG TPA: ComF family protein [Gemmatimonadales bacterium]|nr:ComF family protein [Gemmatimonadales bacterium]
MSSALEQLLLPAECLVCHGLLGPAHADDLVCPVCRLRWRPVRPPWCERCGQPEPHFGPCRLCRDWPEALRAVRSGVWLDGGAREAVHALKYRGLPRIAADLAESLVRLLPRPAPGTQLVPIPLGPARLRRRGYNQSEALARALGRRWGLVVAPQLLVRVRNTPTQTALTPAARLANVAGAFALRIEDCGLRIGRHRRDQSAIRNPQSPIVLVDDVFTTGATLAEAARVLGEAGVSSITAVTFGRASIPDFS